MAVVNKINGTAVNIAFAGTPGGITITNPALSTNFILQSTDETQGASNYRVEDEVGNVIVSAWMDPHTKVTLEMIIKGAGLADVINQTQTVEGITPGLLLVIAACQQQPGLVGTNWEVMDSPKVAGSNKDAKRFTCNLERRAGITATVAP
jgi:hypothetical protein